MVGADAAPSLATVQRYGHRADSAVLTIWIGLPYGGGEGRNDRYGCPDPCPRMGG